jgi:hypothetical protein
LRILSIDEVKRILRVAGEKNRRNALVLKLIAFHGFKLYDVVGSPSRRMENKKWIPMEPNRPGMQIEDLSDDGILLRRKGEEGERRPLNPELVRELRECMGERVRGKIFDITGDRVNQVTKEYAKEARLSDSKKIRPHMFQDFYDGHQADMPQLSSTLLATEPAEPGDHVGQKIDYPGLTYAPTNEQGVVFLFARMSPELGFSAETIRQGYPDAVVIDYRADPNRGFRKNIEFEFKSSGFTKGRKPHDPAKCHIIVCWEHDWKKAPKTIEIIELKSRIQKSERI